MSLHDLWIQEDDFPDLAKANVLSHFGTRVEAEAAYDRDKGQNRALHHQRRQTAKLPGVASRAEEHKPNRNQGAKKGVGQGLNGGGKEKKGEEEGTILKILEPLRLYHSQRF